jgi:hypothetical protein
MADKLPTISSDVKMIDVRIAKWKVLSATLDSLKKGDLIGTTFEAALDKGMTCVMLLNVTDDSVGTRIWTIMFVSNVSDYYIGRQYGVNDTWFKGKKIDIIARIKSS